MDKFCYKNSFFHYTFGDCAYIKGNSMILHYASIQSCSQPFYNALLLRGWRRFGEMFFAPFCDYCNACVSIRQLVKEFKFSKNQNRIINKNKILTLSINPPTFSIEKLRLYNKYHYHMKIKKNWDYSEINDDRYRTMFIRGCLDFGKEFTFYLEDKVIAVAFVDILEECKAMSAIYFFYDHDYAHLSLGVFSILKQIEVAKSLNIDYFYPGYWIKDHHSLGYKERFRPFEVLLNRPDIYEEPNWQLQ